MVERICRWRPRRSTCATCVPGWTGRMFGAGPLPLQTLRAGPKSVIDALRLYGTSGWWCPAAERWAIGYEAWCALVPALVLGCGCRDSPCECGYHEAHYHAHPTKIVGHLLLLLPIDVPTVWPHWYLAPVVGLRWLRFRRRRFLGSWDDPRMDPVVPSVIDGRKIYIPIYSFQYERCYPRQTKQSQRDSVQ